jgi:hypothetical protein
MVPFFVVLLLGSALMVPLTPPPVAAAEAAVPAGVAAEYPVSAPAPDWPAFWQRLNRHVDWDLEWYDGAQWVSVKSDLRIIRDYPEPDRVKLTLTFDASHAGNHRLTFAIDQAVKQYVSRPAEYVYELTYDNCSLVFDWSDAASISGIQFSHGVTGGMFWFRMRRDNVPLGAHVEIDPQLLASLAGTQDSAYSIEDEHPSDAAGEYSAAGQSFTSTGTVKLTSMKLYLKKTGAPTGTATVQLFAHSGTYGTSSVPTGAALATSDAFTVSTLTTDYALVTFTFTGANQYNLVQGTNYCIALVGDGCAVDTSNDVQVGTDGSSPTATGNAFYYDNGAWAAAAGVDAIFYVYGQAYEASVDALASAAGGDGVFTRDEYGWLNATVTYTRGVAFLETVDVVVNTTADINTFTLRWTQATNTFSEVSNPDGMCTLDEVRSVRSNTDADTDVVKFRFKMTGGVDGSCEVLVKVVTDDSSSLSFDGSDDYVNCGSDASLDDLTEFTWAAWVYQSGFTNSYPAVLTKTQKQMYVGTTSQNGFIGISVSAATTAATRYSGTGVFPANTWTHLAVTYSDSGDRKIYLYINGVLFTGGSQTAAQGALTSDAAANLNIGGAAAANSFLGMIDEVRIYNRTLSTTEIAQHAQGIYLNEKGLVLRLNMDNNVDDLSGSDNTASAEGSPTFTDNTRPSATGLYAAEFTYSYWTGLGNIIDDLFDYFYSGSLGFMTMITTYINGLMTYLTGALTNLLALVVQVFIVINGTFTFLVDWFTRIISAFVDIFTIVVGILDGTYEITTGLGNLWTLFSVDDLVTVMPIFLVIAWMSSLDSRAKTQGFMNAFTSDLGFIFNLLSFFLTWMQFVIDTTVNYSLILLDAIIP